MKLTKFILLPIIIIIGFTSCKSDSERMIEKCNTHLAALNSIHTKSDFDNFLEKHPNCLLDFTTAIKKDSIYAEQDLTEAIPSMFNAVYATLDKQEYILLLDCPNEPANKAVILTAMYILKLPYCTKTTQLEEMVQNIHHTTFPILTKYMPNPIEMQVLKFQNEWMEKAIIRKREINAGNLYNSQFLK